MRKLVNVLVSFNQSGSKLRERLLDLLEVVISKSPLERFVTWFLRCFIENIVDGAGEECQSGQFLLRSVVELLTDACLLIRGNLQNLGLKLLAKRDISQDAHVETQLV